jgi:rSAM/selenodomain-associated transferase 2
LRISIIIPTLNEEETIGTLLRELSARAGEDIHEIIVADGGSMDQTRERASEAGARVIECQKTGRAAQMNEGAEAAMGDVLYFLHADTLPPPEFDQHIKRALFDGAGAGCFRLSFSGGHSVLRFYSWFTQFNSSFLRFGDQSLFVKPDVFMKSGRFDESLYVMEDQEIVRRLKKISRFKVIDKAVVTSARKYEENGAFRLQLIYIIIFGLFYAGVRQETLVHLYKSLIKRNQ